MECCIVLLAFLSVSLLHLYSILLQVPLLSAACCIFRCYIVARNTVRLHCCSLKVALFRVAFWLFQTFNVIAYCTVACCSYKIVAFFTVQCCMVALRVFSKTSIFYILGIYIIMFNYIFRRNIKFKIQPRTLALEELEPLGNCPNFHPIFIQIGRSLMFEPCSGLKHFLRTVKLLIFNVKLQNNIRGKSEPLIGIPISSTNDAEFSPLILPGGLKDLGLKVEF